MALFYCIKNIGKEDIADCGHAAVKRIIRDAMWQTLRIEEAELWATTSKHAIYLVRLVYVNWSYYTITVIYCQCQCVTFGDFFSGLLEDS